MTRTIRISVFSVLLVLLCACLVFAADAPRLSVQMDAIEDGQVWSAAKLQDDNWYSKLTFNETGLVEISSDQDIHFHYIVWDRIPGNWLLTEDAQKLIMQGYMHSVLADMNEYPAHSIDTNELIKMDMGVDWVKAYKNREEINNLWTLKVTQ